MLMSAGLPVSANAINEGCRRAHEGVPERQAPCGQPSPHRRKNCVSRNQAQTLAHERVTRQPPTLDYGSTAAWEMEMPSFASSPCMRGAPQRGLALLMFRISSRISGATPGRPGLRRRLFQVQYRLNPQRCQRMTVSGFTMTRTLSQSVQILRNSTQNSRSTFESRSRFTERWRTASCCRRATFSRASS